MTQMHPLSATSALVLLWCGPTLYRTDAAREYWRRLDLSAGQDLYEQCRAVWPNYDAVILNRKWRIMTWSLEHLANEIPQVVIVAAGFAPLGIELASRYPKTPIFELDLHNMEEKARICDGLPGCGQNIQFMTADLNDPMACMESMKTSGWDPELPSLVVIEGISYYIPKASTREVWRLFARGGANCIFEYMVPEHNVALERRYIPAGVFGIIADRCAIDPEMTTWTHEELACERGLNLLRHATQNEIEADRTGEAVVFPTRESGWIEIAELDIRRLPVAMHP